MQRLWRPEPRVCKDGSILANLCPYLAQVHGSRLRLPQVSPADSGEYVCRVENGSGPKEASIIVSVLHSRHPGPGYTPGEERRGWARAEPSGLPCVPEDGARGSLWCYPDRERRSQQAPIPSFPARRDEGSESRDRLT